MYGLAPASLNSCLVALQYGHHDLENTATLLLSMMSCAFVLAAMMVFGLAGLAPAKMERRKFVVGGLTVLV